MVKEIVSEICCESPNLLKEVDMHEKGHKLAMLKRIVFSFISLKGKHTCRTYNREKNSMSRHGKTKEIIFKNE